jgi:hypothetical protein
VTQVRVGGANSEQHTALSQPLHSIQQLSCRTCRLVLAVSAVSVAAGGGGSLSASALQSLRLSLGPLKQSCVN